LPGQKFTMHRNVGVDQRRVLG